MRDDAHITDAVLALVVRPLLWPTAARMAPPGWWRRWPPWPWPSAEYIRFRTQTMYGDDGGGVRGDDLVTYLKWCRRMGCPAR